MKRLFGIVALVLCIGLLGGCYYGGLLTRKVRSSGDAETREYDITDFTGLTLKGNIKRVNLELEKGGYGVEIEADSNYINELKVEKRGDNLRISLDDNRRLSNPITVRVSAPELTALEIQGAMELKSNGQLTGDSLSLNVEGAVEADLDMGYETLEMRIAGAADAKLYGEVEDFTLLCEGAADVDAKRMATRTAKVNVAGAAHVLVDCSDYLDATIEGAGEIEYSGNPEVKKHIAGLGSINQL